MSPRDEDRRDDGCIRIPVRGAQQTVEVYTEELPSDYNDVVDVLKAEIAPLDIWLRFAVSASNLNSCCYTNEHYCYLIGALLPSIYRFCHLLDEVM